MRYSKRSATHGAVTLNSAKERGNTQSYWFYINTGKASCGRDKWVEFDIREVAKSNGVQLPVLITGEELNNLEYEDALQVGLKRAAEFCDSVGFTGGAA